MDSSGPGSTLSNSEFIDALDEHNHHLTAYDIGPSISQGNINIPSNLDTEPKPQALCMPQITSEEKCKAMLALSQREDLLPGLLFTDPLKQFRSTYTNGKDNADDNESSIYDFDNRYVFPKNKRQAVSFRMLKVMNHLVYRLITVLLLLVHIVTIGLDLARLGNQIAMQSISLVILTYFMLDEIIRMCLKGMKAYFQKWIHLLDFTIVTLCFMFSYIYLVTPLNSYTAIAKFMVVGRFLRIGMVLHLYLARQNLTVATREIVSQNKRRYQKDGFNLDLSYITDRVIAMSLPATGWTACYRNPISEVVRFLDTKHGSHYKVYNLGSESYCDYDTSIFHGPVERIYIADHNVAKLQDLVHFVLDVDDWMSRDPLNVIAVHCKGGKGRTGLMICTYLMHAGYFEEVDATLDYFGYRRTDMSVGKNFQGVQTPSQGRYISYMDTIHKKYNGCIVPPEVCLLLATISLKRIRGVGLGNGKDFWCEMIHDEQKDKFDFSSEENCVFEPRRATRTLIIADSPILRNDIKVIFHSTSNIPISRGRCVFYFWFHTSMIEDNRLWLARDELDNLHRLPYVFAKNFGVEITFKDPALSPSVKLNEKLAEVVKD